MKKILFILQRWETKIVLVVFASVLVAGFILAPGFFWTKRVSGNVCVKCGASKNDLEIEMLGIVWYCSTEIQETSLTMLQAKYIGSCDHDWAFRHHNQRVLNGDAAFADAFPANDFPTAQFAEKIAAGIERLPNSGSKVVALQSIASRPNLLRWLAALTLMDLGSFGEVKISQFRAENWWLANSNLFTNCTNVFEADQILKALQDSGITNVQTAVEWNVSWLEQRRK